MRTTGNGAYKMKNKNTERSETEKVESDASNISNTNSNAMSENDLQTNNEQDIENDKLKETVSNPKDTLLALSTKIDHIKKLYNLKNIDLEITSNNDDYRKEYRIEVFKNSNVNINFKEVFYINENKDISILVTETINHLDEIIKNNPNKLPVIQNETNYYKKMKVQSFNDIMKNRFIMSDEEISELIIDIYANKLNEPNLSDEVRRLKKELNIARSEILSNQERTNIFKTIIVMLTITTMVFHPEIIKWYSNQVVQFEKLIEENTMYKKVNNKKHEHKIISYIAEDKLLADKLSDDLDKEIKKILDEEIVNSERSKQRKDHDASSANNQNNIHNNIEGYKINIKKATLMQNDSSSDSSSQPIEIGYADVNKTEHEEMNNENMRKWKDGK